MSSPTGARTPAREGAETRREISTGALAILGRVLTTRARLPELGYRAALRRVPRAAWICALVACLNALSWSIVTPPFQAPDETDHFAYVKQLAETGELPSSSSEQISAEELAVLFGLRHFYVMREPQNHTIATQAEVEELHHYLALASQPTIPGSPAAGVAASQPPLYYALESIPYRLAGGNVLDRLEWMRFTSALMTALTAMFAFMFVREAAPGARWAWPVGGLAVALVPLLGFMSGSVNPDSLLFAVSAASFYCLARAFRRGLSTHGAIAIGTATALGFLTKVNFIGLAPGILLGVIVLAMRVKRASGRFPYRLLALSAGVALSPVVLYVAINAFSNRALLGFVSTAIASMHGSVLAEFNYIWQIYLPHLPGTVNDFPGLSTARQMWFHGYVGLFGWFDTTFPNWVYDAALIPAGTIALLLGRALVQGRGALRARAAEIAVYATIGIGLMTLIAADAYHAFPTYLATYAQARYLLPLLPLLAVGLALAARAAGRRWGPIVGTTIVMLFLAHDIFSQLLVAGRYYG